MRSHCRVMSSRRRKPTALSQEALGLPPCVTRSTGAVGAPGHQSQPPPGGGRPPAPCQQTRTCGRCWPPGPSGSRWGLGPMPVLHLERPSPTGPARVWPPGLWNLLVWARPSWCPRGLGWGAHPGREGLQGPWGRAGLNSEAGGTRGPRREAQRPSAGQPGPHAGRWGGARPAASGQRRAVGRRLLNASGSGRGRKGPGEGPVVLGTLEGTPPSPGLPLALPRTGGAATGRSSASRLCAAFPPWRAAGPRAAYTPGTPGARTPATSPLLPREQLPCRRTRRPGNSVPSAMAASPMLG